jgi:TRAP-type mannitol/chloroaromatic compound transport system substrate-binding protein
MKIDRRDLLKTAGAAAIISSPYVIRASAKPGAILHLQTYAGSELGRYVVKPGVDIFNKIAAGEGWRIELHYSDDIVPQKKLWDAVASGAVDIAQSDEGSSGCPLDIAIFSGYFPFACRYPLDVSVLWSHGGIKEIWEDAYKEVPEITWLGCGSWDPCNIITKKPILSVEDLKGQKLYTFDPGGEFLKGYGVIHVPMLYEEVYTALQNNLLDGTAWCGVTEAYTVGWAKNTRYCLTNNIDGAWVGSYFINTERWNQMPFKVQDMLRLSIDQSHYYRLYWYWWGEEYYRDEGNRLELTTIPLNEWHAVENDAIRFWGTIAMTSPRRDKVVKVLTNYKNLMDRSGPPYYFKCD